MNSIENRLIALFIRHPDFFVGSISSSYPLTIEQLYKYKDKLKWVLDNRGFFMYGLSSNKFLPWSESLIDEFYESWDWSGISSFILGDKLWFKGILEKYVDKLLWNDVSFNTNIPWASGILIKFSGKLDWKQISGNRSVPWSSSFIEKFADKIDFHILGNCLSSQFNNIRTIDVKNNIENPLSLTERIELIEKYEHKFDWNCLQFDWENGLSRKSKDDIINEILSNSEHNLK